MWCGKLHFGRDRTKVSCPQRELKAITIRISKSNENDAESLG